MNLGGFGVGLWKGKVQQKHRVCFVGCLVGWLVSRFDVRLHCWGSSADHELSQEGSSRFVVGLQVVTGSENHPKSI